MRSLGAGGRATERGGLAAALRQGPPLFYPESTKPHRNGTNTDRLWREKRLYMASERCRAPLCKVADRFNSLLEGVLCSLAMAAAARPRMRAAAAARTHPHRVASLRLPAVHRRAQARAWCPVCTAAVFARVLSALPMLAGLTTGAAVTRRVLSPGAGDDDEASSQGVSDEEAGR